MIAAQLGIATLGVTAVYLSQDTRASHRRWSSAAGLAGQPFWFFETITARQWGMVALCCLYTMVWARGFWSFWIAPRWPT
jgi:hypothetical protein